MRAVLIIAIAAAVIVVVPSAQGTSVKCATVTQAMIKRALGISVGRPNVYIDTTSQVNCTWVPRSRSGTVGVNVEANIPRSDFRFEQKRNGERHPPKALRALGVPAFAFTRTSDHTRKSNVWVLKGGIQLSVFAPVPTAKTIALVKQILPAL